MRTIFALLLVASVCLFRVDNVRAAEVVLARAADAEWPDSDGTPVSAAYAHLGSLDTRLEGVDPAGVGFLSVGLVPIQYLPDTSVLEIETRGLTEPRIDVDPLSGGRVPSLAPCAGVFSCPVLSIPFPRALPTGSSPPGS